MKIGSPTSEFPVSTERVEQLIDDVRAIREFLERFFPQDIRHKSPDFYEPRTLPSEK